MLALSKITNDKPMPAVETAVWWIEYVLRHNGAPHLRPACMDLAWYQYYSIDIVAAIAAIVVSFLSICFYCGKMVVKKLMHSKLKEE
ncbi:hypothetical protein LSTR_LSTR017033 [Laodelphax striatellus]|uniref:UDP-glucuronosyltransferase n=1 Tax=Laodelphax striatellus TaxID=195883 RepID=A0A482WP22_LAOST|nr:hypothetical protein LSTR_LSTR017033 [Laodelphax striatellus]